MPGKQRGLALLVLLALFALSASYLLVKALNRGSVALRLTRTEHNRAVMQQAKDALIAYAAIKAQTSSIPGALPCPDINNDGNEDSGCSSTTRLGRLPYKTLGIGELRDASGELLWYAVSRNFRNYSNTVNSDTQGTLSVSGLAPVSNAAAVVLAPGMRLGSQDRSASGVNTASNYLEGINGDTDANDYITATEKLIVEPTDAPGTIEFNDQLLAITQAELMAAVEPVVAARIEGEIKPDIVAYSSLWTPNAFPYAAIFANPDPGTSATRAQSQYIGSTSTSATGGLLPITATAAYTWSAGAVNLTGGTAGSISVTSCASTSSPINGLQCSFTIYPYNPPWWDWWTCGGSSYCMVNPSFSVSGNVANAGLSFAIPPNVGDVTVKSSVYGSNRTMTSTSLTRALAASGTGTLTYQGTHSYSNYSSSWFTRNMVVTIPDLTPSPVTSSTDTTAGWFIANEWYRQVYYMVSPGALPAGTGCTPLPGTPSCLTVNNMPSYYTSPSNDKTVVLMLAGRSLNGSSRPSSSLTDYLEGENSTPGDFIFEHGAAKVTSTGSAINDKVIVVAP